MFIISLPVLSIKYDWLMALVHVRVSQTENMKRTIDNYSSALDLATCAKTSPFIGQSISSSVSCLCAAL